MIVDSYVHFGSCDAGFKTDIKNLLNMSLVDKICILPFFDVKATEDPNPKIYDLISNTDEEIYGFLKYSPTSFERFLNKNEKFLKNEHIIGICIDPQVQNIIPDDQKMDDLWTYMQKNNIPLFVNSVGRSPLSIPDTFGNVLDIFDIPRIIFGGYLHQYVNNIKNTAEENPAIFIETSSLPYGWLRILIESIGCEQFIFGSDSPYSDIELEIKKVEKLDLEDDKKEKIFNKNFKKLSG